MLQKQGVKPTDLVKTAAPVKVVGPGKAAAIKAAAEKAQPVAKAGDAPLAKAAAEKKPINTANMLKNIEKDILKKV